MARPLWTGAISFGLLHIPVQLMPAERREELHLRMLDSRNNAPVKYQRVNAETGEEVPWDNIVKAYQYEKGNYVVLEEEDLKKAAPQTKETVDIEVFIDAAAITPKLFEKPYYLVPGRKAEKGYVLLRDTLAELKKAGLARVVIRTREYLALVIPEGDALVMLLMRYPAELIDADEYALPGKSGKDFKVSTREMDMARQLVGSMSGDWQPEDFRDEFRERLKTVIQARIGKKKVVHAPADEAETEAGTATNVVDFMSLLRDSIQRQKRTPAKSPPLARARSAKTPRPKAAAGKAAAIPAVRPRRRTGAAR